MKKGRKKTKVRRRKSEENQEDNTSFFSKITYSWITSIIQLGSQKALEMKDLPSLSSYDKAQYLVNLFSEVHVRITLDHNPEIQSQKRKGWFFDSLWKVLRFQVLLAGFYLLMGDFFAFASPFILKLLLDFAEDESSALFLGGNFGYFLCLLLFLSIILSSILTQKHHFIARREGMHAKSIIMSFIFKKALCAPMYSGNTEKNNGKGQLTNLWSTDSLRVMNKYMNFNNIWRNPIKIILAMLLAATILGKSALYGSLICLLYLIPAQIKLGLVTKSKSKIAAKNTDLRLQKGRELVSNIREIKFLTLEDSFLAKAKEKRENELQLIFYLSILKSLNQVLLEAAPMFISIVIFAAYTIFEDDPLTPQKAFPVVSLIYLVRESFQHFPMVVQFFMDSHVSERRIERFLGSRDLRGHSMWQFTGNSNDFAGEPEFDIPTFLSENTKESYSFEHKEELSSKGAIEINGGEFRVKNDTMEPYFSELDVKIKPGELCVCVGQLGGGKTSFLSAILGEMHFTADEEIKYYDYLDCKIKSENILNKSVLTDNLKETNPKKFYNGRISFASQTPWILNLSVQENILMNKKYEKERYWQIIKICGLDEDLKSFPKGDQTEILEHGANLSGGQSQRINVARAVYQDADIYMFDDPLSALDVELAEQIFAKLFLTFLKDKTRILVTNHLNLASKADKVIVISKIEEENEKPDRMDSKEKMKSNTKLNVFENLNEEALSILSELGKDSSKRKDLKNLLKIYENLHEDNLIEEVKTPRESEDTTDINIVGIDVDNISKPNTKSPNERRYLNKNEINVNALTKKTDELNKKYNNMKEATEFKYTENNLRELKSDNLEYNHKERRSEDSTEWSFPPRLRSRSKSSAKLEIGSFQEMLSHSSTFSNLFERGRESTNRLNNFAKNNNKDSIDDPDEEERSTISSISSETLTDDEDNSEETSRLPSLSSEIHLMKKSRSDNHLLKIKAKSSRKEKRKTTKSKKKKGTNIKQKHYTQKNSIVEKRNEKLVADENNVTGKVSFKIYIAYIRAMGAFLTVFLIICILLIQGSEVITDVWLSEWSKAGNDNNGKNEDSVYYLKVFAGFSCFTMILTAGELVLASIMGVRASRRLYGSVLEAVAKSPVTFFDSTPIGRILNRLSHDTEIMDKHLLSALNYFVVKTAKFVSILMLISFISWNFIFFCAPILYFFYKLGSYFRHTSSELQRLDNASKSPIFIQFSQLIDGLVTIRTGKLQNWCIKLFYEAVDSNLKCFWCLSVANRWLAVRMDGLGAFVVLSTAMVMITFRDDIQPSFIGLAISSSFIFLTYLNYAVRYGIYSEMFMSSIERIHEYSNLLREPSTLKSNDNDDTERERKGDEVEDLIMEGKWPSEGKIFFENVSARYKENSPLILEGFDLEIKPGKKVGICGRSGSGKSTLIALLLRVIGCTEGRILIDSMDISAIPLKKLRRSITIISQIPKLFNDSIRFNLDPFNEFTDDELMKVIEKVNLDKVMKQNGLEWVLEEGGKEFSIGEIQIICLARAMLMKTKILILDEATASVDLQADEFMQKIIREHFKDCTVITIAHRIETILDYDEIIVMGDGEILEHGDPDFLLKDEKSIFHSLVKRKGEHSAN